MDKIKLGRMESAFLAEMFRYGLHHMEEGVGTHRAENQLLLGAEGFEINSLIKNFQEAFDLEETEWMKIEDIRRIVEHYRVSNGKASRRDEPYFNENLTLETAFDIMDLHIKDMMDSGRYCMPEEDRMEIIRVFGGTFRHERGEMIKELLDIMKKELKEPKSMEMEKLADYLLKDWQEEFGKGEDPGAGESAADMAIRLLKRYKEGELRT